MDAKTGSLSNRLLLYAVFILLILQLCTSLHYPRAIYPLWTCVQTILLVAYFSDQPSLSLIMSTQIFHVLDMPTQRIGKFGKYFVGSIIVKEQNKILSLSTNVEDHVQKLKPSSFFLATACVATTENIRLTQQSKVNYQCGFAQQRQIYHD